MNPGPIDHPWMDSSESPLYYFAFPPAAELAEVEAFAKAREDWSRGVQGQVAFVCDLSKVDYSAVTPLHRKTFTDHMKRFKAFEVEHTAAVGFVARGKMLRGLVTAVFWLVPAVFPHKTFEKAEDARAWARGILAGSAEGRSPDE